MSSLIFKPSPLRPVVHGDLLPGVPRFAGRLADRPDGAVTNAAPTWVWVVWFEEVIHRVPPLSRRQFSAKRQKNHQLCSRHFSFLHAPLKNLHQLRIKSIGLAVPPRCKTFGNILFFCGYCIARNSTRIFFHARADVEAFHIG